MTKTASSVPFDRAYWVIPRKLAAGCYPGDLDPGEAERKLRGLIQAGIRYVINLMEETELNWYGNIFISYENDLKRYAAHMGVDLARTRGVKSCNNTFFVTLSPAEDYINFPVPK